MGIYNEKVEIITNKEIETLQNDLINTGSLSELRNVKSKVTSLPKSNKRDQLLEDIESDEEGLRELGRYQNRKEKLRNTIRDNIGTPEELEQAEEDLRELNAQSLGQIKGLKSRELRGFYSDFFTD